MIPRKLTLSEATKILVVASERGYSNFVCMGFQIQLVELNQMLTKAFMLGIGVFT